MLIDLIKLKVIAGKGGDGVIAWRREKCLPKGGPYGGDGGRGGHIIFEASPHILGLDALRNLMVVQAKKGEPGGSAGRHGSNGEDLILRVPPGTIFRDLHTGHIIKELLVPGERWLACTGGKGGLGNIRFKTATCQAPYKCTPGKEGGELDLEIELKMLADISLVGFPNAGKSTLFTALTRSHAKIGDYPFTTLWPNLGFVQFEDYTRLTIADIPGLIEKAHEGKGLGFEFLKHVERSSFFIFVIDCNPLDGRDPLEDYAILRAELTAYAPDLNQRPSIIALSKTDTWEKSEEELEALMSRFPVSRDLIIPISAIEQKGISQIIDKLFILAKKSSISFH